MRAPVIDQNTTSTSISTSVAIRQRLTQDGYAYYRGSDLSIPQRLRAAQRELTDAYENLPLDIYAPQCNRYRRHSRFVLLPWEGYLSASPKNTFYQSTDYNPDDGGMMRKFENLELQTLRNELLHELIRFDFGQIPLSAEEVTRPIDVGVHMIRLLATPSSPGISTPNCLHKDGEPFTYIHLIQRKNVQGGESLVADNGKEVILTTILEQALDTVVVADKDVYHHVKEIYVDDGATKGIRDVLLIDFTPLTPNLVAVHGISHDEPSVTNEAV